MNRGMVQIDYLINLCFKLEEEFVRIKIVKLLFKEFQAALKFNARDVKNVCASNVLPIP